MRKIGVGVIGWGFMGMTHTLALRSMPLFYPGIEFEPELVYVCSRNLKKAKEAARSMGFAHFTGDYRELLKCPKVEVVSICTPNDLHEEMAVAAFRAGKHVYLDKPMSTDGASAERILLAAKESNKNGQMVFHNRFYPAMIRAKEMIEGGKIGRIISFDFNYLHSGSVDPNRPMGWKQGVSAGVLHDLGSHIIDLAVYLMGMPKQVFCTLSTLYPERPRKEGGFETKLGDDQALMILAMPGGAVGSLKASKIATGTEDELSFAIYGTEGALRLNAMDLGSLYYFSGSAKDVPYGGERGFLRIATGGRYPPPGGSFLPPKNQIGWERGHMHCYYSFLKSVFEEKPAAPSMEDGALVQMILSKMALSHERRTWIDLD